MRVGIISAVLPLTPSHELPSSIGEAKDVDMLDLSDPSQRLFACALEVRPSIFSHIIVEITFGIGVGRNTDMLDL